MVWAYGKAFFSDLAWARRVKTPLLVLVLTVHAIYLIARTIQFAHPPITTVFEILTLLAFSVAVVYLVIETRTKAKGTGYFVLNIAFFFQLGSSLFIQDLLEVPEVLRNNLLGLHVFTALVGYAAITVSAVYGFLYLMLYHEIKASQFGVIYKKLPNLETLERMSFSAFRLAFWFLGLAIVVGFVWLPYANVAFSYGDPKFVGTLLLWSLYGLGILAKRRAEWKGRRVMILSICGFAITLFSLTVINVFFSDFHRFY